MVEQWLIKDPSQALAVAFLPIDSSLLGNPCMRPAKIYNVNFARASDDIFVALDVKKQITPNLRKLFVEYILKDEHLGTLTIVKRLLNDCLAIVLL